VCETRQHPIAKGLIAPILGVWGGVKREAAEWEGECWLVCLIPSKGRRGATPHGRALDCPQTWFCWCGGVQQRLPIRLMVPRSPTPRASKQGVWKKVLALALHSQCHQAGYTNEKVRKVLVAYKQFLVVRKDGGRRQVVHTIGVE